MCNCGQIVGAWWAVAPGGAGASSPEETSVMGCPCPVSTEAEIDAAGVTGLYLARTR